MREFIGDAQFTMCLSACNARVVKKSKVCLQYYVNVCVLSVKTYKCINFVRILPKRVPMTNNSFMVCTAIVCYMSLLGMCSNVMVTLWGQNIGHRSQVTSHKCRLTIRYTM